MQKNLYKKYEDAANKCCNKISKIYTRFDNPFSSKNAQNLRICYIFLFSIIDIEYFCFLYYRLERSNWKTSPLALGKLFLHHFID